MPSDHDPAALLEAARSAAAAAADHLRTLDRAHIDAEEKTSLHDLVTEHDRACEEIIVARLQELVPGCRIVGEEGGLRESADAHGDAGDVPTFYVDPIDGTSNFASGTPLFCVSIGVALDGRLVAGVIDAPALGQVFTAGPDGALLNGRPLRGRETRDQTSAVVLTGHPAPRDLDPREDLALEGARRIGQKVRAVRNLGSAALELAWVAAGWADATFSTLINSWDVAAGFALVEAAGGSVRTWPGRGPADAAAWEMPAYVACTGQRRVQVLDAFHDSLQAAREAGTTAM